MSELVMLKKENKNLKKQLKGENRKLFLDIDYYISRHSISKHEYQSLIKEVLLDFTDRTNLGEELWDTIEDPKAYIDKYIEKYELKKMKWEILTSLYILAFISIVCFYFISLNLISPSSIMLSNPWLIEVSTEGLLKCLSYSTFGLYYELIEKSSLFKKNKPFSTHKVLLFFVWAMIMFVILAISEIKIITITLPKVIVYLVLFICILLVYLIQKKRIF